MIEIEEKAVPVIVDIKGGEVTANITPAHDVSITVGESATLEATAAVNYIKSGEAEINAYATAKIAEYNANASAKTTAYNTNATSKTDDYNENHDEKLLVYNDNADGKVADFDNNASDKTSAFNENAENQFDDYNANASNKLNAYNQNASDKTAAYNQNAAAQTTAFNDNATIKQAAVDASANAAAASATTAQNWAIKMDGKIDNVDYSAKYYAAQAEEAAAGVGNPANRDLSNLTATGEAKFTAKQDVISDLSTIRSGAAAGATAVQPAALANYVDTSTDQTIGGVKTFTNDTIVIKNMGYAYSETPAANQYSQWRWTDKNDNWISQFYSALYTNGNARTAMSLKNKSGSSALLGLLYNGSGEFYTEAPTPTDTTTTSGTQIATTGWVNTTGNNVVHKTGNETIAGTKTFSSTISGSIDGNAATVTNGVYTDTDQTISGQKTFNNPIVYRGNPYLLLSSSSLTKGTNPSGSSINSVVAFTGNDKGTASASSLGRFAFQVATNGTVFTQMRCYKNEASSTTAVYFSLYYPTSDSAYAETSAYLRPSGDNSLNLGDSSHRWKQLYAGTTTISTSDERLKQGIETIPDAVLDAWGEVEFYRYKFNDSVAEKGFDNARYHTGMVAQRIERIFAEHGLNAFDYGLLCFDEWQAEPEVRDEENEIIKPAVAAGDRYSLRYEECLCMEAAYQRRRADRIEKRLNALEARAE